MIKFKDRIKESSITTGLGTITLGGATPGFRTFSSSLAVGDSFYYVIEQNADFEVGMGTLATTSTFTRDTIIASSTGSKLDLAAGTKSVYLTIASTYFTNQRAMLPGGPVTYYLDVVNGSNSNPGTVGSPWQTIQGALDILGTMDMNNTTVTLSLAASATSYAGAQLGWGNPIRPHMVGGGRIEIRGADRDTTKINGSINVSGSSATVLALYDFSFVSASVAGIVADNNAYVEYSNLNFAGVGNGTHIVSDRNSLVACLSHYRISANAVSAHISLARGGRFTALPACTVTFVNTLTIGFFIDCFVCGMAYFQAMAFAGTYLSVTGGRCRAQHNSTILTNSAPATTYFPGTSGQNGTIDGTSVLTA